MAFWRGSGRPRLYGAIAPREQHLFELIIGTARVFLAATALLAVYFDPSEPTVYAHLTSILLLLYDVHSVCVLLLLLRLGPGWPPVISVVLHGIDLLWAVSITFLTEGPNSPFFPMFIFVLLAAAFRWGFRETMMTGAITATLFLMQAIAVVVTSGPAALPISRVVMRCTYFLLATFLLAYLSEQEKILKAEATAVNRLVDKIHVRDGLRACVQRVFGDILAMLGARQAFAALEERDTGRLVVWEAVADGTVDGASVQVRELDRSEAPNYLFPLRRKVGVWEAARRSTDASAPVRSRRLDENNRARATNITLPSALTDLQWNVLLGVPVALGEEWTGRMFVVDVTARPAGASRLRFLERVVSQVAPVIHNVYLLRRLRSRVGAIERGRVARELHDSVVQSLIGLEMQLEVARREPSTTPGHAERLAQIQNLLRDEILNVRDLMQQLRAHPADGKELVDRLTDMVDRFRRDTGIQARFISDLNGAELAPQVCRELTRVVQEGLVNVRKHSQASHVLVRLGTEDGAWSLVIEDDGQGFGFVGSLSHEELETSRIGPRVIRERIEAIGGELTATSGQGGVRLEMTGPVVKHG